MSWHHRDPVPSSSPDPALVGRRWLRAAGSGLLLCGAITGSALAVKAPAPAPAPKKVASAVTVNPAPFLRQLGLIGGDLRNFQAVVDANLSDAKSSKPMSFRLKVAVRFPDSVRMDVVSSSNGLFRGYKFSRMGSAVRVYDPISERVTDLNLATITGRQPIRMDLGIDLLAGIFRPRNYEVTQSGKTTLNGKPAVFMRLIPRRGYVPPQSILRLSHMMVWMDPVKRAPLKQESYGSEARLRGGYAPVKKLFTITFSRLTSGGAGLWYPAQVDIRTEHPKGGAPKVTHSTLIRVNGCLVSKTVSTEGGDGALQLTYSAIQVNQGLPPDTFNPGG